MDNKGLPISGYVSQPDSNIEIVNVNKDFEEQLLRMLDALGQQGGFDPRWLSVARTHFEQGFMAMNRAVFQPTRVKIKTDINIPADK